jgi:hypothetical protein
MNRSFLWVTTFIFCISSFVYLQMQRVPINIDDIHRLRSEITKDLIIDLSDGDQISISRCGFVHFENTEIDMNADDIQRWSRSGSIRSDISIPIAFHVIYASDNSGYVSEAAVSDQVNVLNSSYSSWGISFTLSSLDYTENDTWFYNDNESQYKFQLAISPATTLNIYTTSAGGYLGYAYLPNDFNENSYMHGVVLHYQSLPGVYNWQYDEGDTGVHEVGHYLGLLHTFGNFNNGNYGDCTVGDYVEDTPDQDGTEEENVYVCNDNLNTCPDDGNDPVHNYMNYADDECLDEFTAGQEERMKYMLDTFRPSLGDVYGCSNALGDMNGDEEWHVDDIVLLVNCILTENCSTLVNGCAGDMSGDEEWHVDDIVLLVNCILIENCFEIFDD